MNDQLAKWREDPALFVRENFKVEPDRWQLKALEAFASGNKEMQRISLRACAGPGKSAVLAWCGWNFLSCYGERGEHPKGAVVAVTWNNLSDNLWPEFAKWQSRSPFLSHYFTWTKTRIYCTDHPETWFLSARSFNKSANAEEQGRTLSGIHSKYVLFLIDESGDIPITVSRAAEQAMSAEKFAKIVQAGNPTSHEGMLYAAATSLNHLWHNIRITADPNDPDRTPRVPVEFAKEQIETYGIDNPWVKAYILGEFPDSALNTLLTLKDVETAMSRGYKEGDVAHAQKRLGIDVARFGLDSTVIFPRQGLQAYKYVTMQGARNHEISARVMQAKIKWGSELEFIDGTGGFGAGVVDQLYQAGQSPQEIHFSSKAINQRFLNRRAEMWFEMAEWIKRGGALPNDERLKKELVAPQYTLDKGRFQLEPKEHVKKRLGFSPDCADALALTFALPEMPASMTIEHIQKHGYSPTQFQSGNVGKLKRSTDEETYQSDPY